MKRLCRISNQPSSKRCLDPDAKAYIQEQIKKANDIIFQLKFGIKPSIK